MNRSGVWRHPRGAHLGLAWLAALILSVDMLGCAAPAGNQASPAPQGKGAVIKYRDLLRSLEVDQTEARPKRLVLKFTEPISGAPAPGVSVDVLSASQPVTVTSDAKGMATLSVQSTWERENAIVVIRADRKLTLNVTSVHPIITAVAVCDDYATTVFQGGHVPEVRVTTAGKMRLAGKGFDVWYGPALESTAAHVAEVLSRQRDFLENTLGLEPTPWTMVLIRQVDYGKRYVTLNKDFGGTAIVCDAENTGFFLYAISTHEWCEKTLVDRLDLYRSDIRARFIGDGLAEYALVTFANNERQDGYYRDTDPLIDLESLGVASVNLLKEFVADRHLEFFRHYQPWRQSVEAGYCLSLAFWCRIERENGPGLPARFVRAFAAEKKHNVATAIRLLDSMTHTDIRHRLEHAPVAESLDIIRSLSPGAPLSVPAPETAKSADTDAKGTQPESSSGKEHSCTQ